MDKYIYWLSVVSCIGGNKKRRLYDFFGSCEKIFLANESELKQCKVFANIEEIKLFIKEKELIRDDYEEFLKDNQIGLITVLDESYPLLLRMTHDHPFCLFFRGNLPNDFYNAVAVVGARNCSGYGQQCAQMIGEDIARNGGIVVSGMAKGVDGASHYGALSVGGKTVAVLGSGVDVCYPRSHKRLYERIIEEGGAIVSELAPGAAPYNWNFPARNRIISGLSRAVIVVEARAKSGSLITVDFALEQGRDVYALPGRITDSLSKGANNLIYQGACIISGREELINQLYDDGILSHDKKKDSKENNLSLEKNEKLLYSCLDFYAKSIDELALESELDIISVMEILDKLVKRNLVKETAKNHYIIQGE